MAAMTAALTQEPWRMIQAGTFPTAKGNEITTEIAVIGGGVGGYAGALAALEAGRTVVMTEETDWIGGQLTSQAVPPDENPWVETSGANRSYQDFRRAVRSYYKSQYPLTDTARRESMLNPGNGSVSRLCHEPRVALAVMTDTLARYVSRGQLIVLTNHKATGATTQGDKIETVRLRDRLTGEERIVRAAIFLDATEMGDLAELAGAEHVTGFEARSETGEPLAPEQAQPANHQAFTVCFALEHRPSEDHTIEKPAEYDFWKDYKPNLKPAWTGKLLSLTYSHPITLEPRTLSFDPTRPDEAGWWKYRRIIDAAKFEPGTYPTSGVCLVNWPQNDYLPGNLYGPGVTPADAENHLKRARQLSLSLVYWLQTAVVRPDGGTGWPGLKLRGDLLGTQDGLAKYPYIRESRRLRTRFTVTTAHVATEDRKKKLSDSSVPITAEPFADSVGIGAYRIDLHPSTGGDNYIDISSLPFRIPLGSLVPVRFRNLLPACKNLGVTHLTNGCYRLHPVEWGIGEAAGTLAAFNLDRKSEPHQVHEKEKLRADFFRVLESRGVRRAWEETRPL
ncbi:FAD-dependent oxidoreductase [bacterium]|nr:FAD-dependent oxidoreductase [bacterium]